MVPRYDLVGNDCYECFCEMKQDKLGDYVAYEDYARLLLILKNVVKDWYDEYRITETTNYAIAKDILDAHSGLEILL